MKSTYHASLPEVCRACAVCFVPDVCQEMELQSKAATKPDPVNQERYNKTLGSKNL